MKVKQINKIKGLEHINDGYYVSYDGRVFSLRDKHGTVSMSNKHELKQYEKTGGYLNVALTTKHNKTNYLRVNRLVALAFVKGKTSKRKYILGRNVHLSVNKNSDNLYPYLNREYSEGNQYMMGCYTESNQKILTERNMYKYPLTSRKKISTEEDIIKKILMRKRVIKK